MRRSSEPDQRPTAAASGRDLPVGPAPVVFVVDDDEGIRRALARLLRAAGLAAEDFPSAQAFLAAPRSDRPCCLILDVRLPGASGLDLQATLDQARLDIPIVFITGHGDVPTSVRAMKAGAVDFLEKPFNDRDLLECVHRALARSHKRRAEQAERALINRRAASLTPREREVMLLVVTGLLNKQIADQLGAAEKTIKIHRARVMEKMSAGSVADLVRMTEKIDRGTIETP